MAKNKSKPEAPVPTKKSGDGGRITKPNVSVDKAKATAKAVVAATKDIGGSKLKGILKPSAVCGVYLNFAN